MSDIQEMYSFLLIDSPVGRIKLTSLNEKLVALEFVSEEPKERTAIKTSSCLEKTARELEKYFAGTGKTFTCDLDPMGTAFQKHAWKELQLIPYGQTISYSEQAEKVGGKQYCRAVGQANKRNPLPIIIPCHRVIGKSGKLTGYASGLSRKQKLLELEAKYNFEVQ